MFECRESLYKFLRSTISSSSELSQYESAYIREGYFGAGGVFGKARDILQSIPVPYYEEMDDNRHLLGNLTVVTNEHNSSVGNKTLGEKKAFPTFPGNAAPLSLNKDWLNEGQDQWTPKMIHDRAISLMNAVVGHWETIKN